MALRLDEAIRSRRRATNAPNMEDAGVGQVKAELAPTGVLRAGINLSNFLLVTGQEPTAGDPVGVAPDMAREIARRLGVPVKLRDLQDAGRAGRCGRDRRLGHRADRRRAAARREDRVHARPTWRSRRRTSCRRARRCKSIADVDRPGVRIAVTGRAAYGLWLERNIKNAELVRSDTLASADRAVRARQAGGARRAPAAADLGRREDARRAHSRRQVHGGAAGRSARRARIRPAPLSCAISSRR